MKKKSDVVTLTNLGSAAIDITNISLEGTAFTAASTAPLGLLEPGSSTEMWISYTPLNLQDQVGFNQYRIGSPG